MSESLFARRWQTRLERAGRTHVAAMAGGLSAWRRLGLGTSRGSIQSLEPQRTRERQGLLSIEEMRVHLGDPRSVRWVKLALLVSSWHVSCIDGRDERTIKAFAALEDGAEGSNPRETSS